MLEAIVPELISGLLSLIVAVVVAHVTAKATVHHALQQFRSERWFDRKAEGYDMLLKQLAQMVGVLGEWEGIFLRIRPDPTAEGREELDAVMKRAKRALRVVSAVGSYRVSKQAATAVTELLRGFEFGGEADVVGAIQRQWTATSDCIETVKQEALRELPGGSV